MPARLEAGVNNRGATLKAHGDFVLSYALGVGAQLRAPNWANMGQTWGKHWANIGQTWGKHGVDIGCFCLFWQNVVPYRAVWSGHVFCVVFLRLFYRQGNYRKICLILWKVKFFRKF